MSFPFTAGRSSFGLVLALGAACLASPAGAHGPPPAIVQVAAADESGPRVVTLTEGLAMLLGGRWVFVCPSLFGSPDPPRALSADGRLTWVASTAGTFTLDDSGRVQPLALPAGNSGPVIALAAADGAIFGLRFSAGGTDVVQMHPGARVVVSDAAPWSCLAAVNSSLLLGRMDGPNLIVRELSTSGEEIRTDTLESDGQGALVDLRASAETTYAALFSGEAYALHGVRGGALEPAVMSSSSPILGPAATSGGSLWIGSSTRLERLPAEGGFTQPEAPLSCLENRGSQAFACLQHRLHALGDRGIGPVLMGLDELVPPAVNDGDLSGSEECWYEWVVFRNDLRNIGIHAERDMPENAPDAADVDAGLAARDSRPAGGCGCRFNRDGSGGSLTLSTIALLCVVISRRARSRDCD